ncbi:MAG: fibronectin type III domain-containing protein [Bacteroidales bacterium]|nr:fibronectin type III domain-containing protein [Bacteroidales bacterium]
MNKHIKKFAFAVSFLAFLFTGGCTDDILPEITTLDVDRLFSPTDLDARVVNQTSVRLTWKKVNKADFYNVEFFENANEDFSGAPERAVNGVLFEDLPLVVAGFAGETTYSVRVQAVGEGIDESKWISTTFTTDAEQILFPIDPEEITASGVTLRWPAGEFATHITLMPGDINRPVTADEVAEGVAVITGLQSETEYTAKLMNEDKTRGTMVFTTLIDIGDAILVNPGDDLKAIVEAAQPGDAFALMPGEYVIEGNIEIYTNLSIIGARPYDKPEVLGAVFRMKDGSALRLKDLILDGATSPDGNQLVIYDEVGTYGDLIIEDCVIKNNVKGVIYGSVAALVEYVLVKGTIIANVECVGGDFIDFRSGMPKALDFINNTVYNSALNRDLFRLDNATAYSGDYTVLVNIESNTFYNIISTDGTTRRVLYIRLASHEITVKKNIFAQVLGNYSNQSATTVVEMSSNNYHNADNLFSPEFTVYDSGNYTTYNPSFVDPANGNFTVTNEELIIFRIGDPRWLP